MPQPTSYTPTADFSADELNNVGGRSTVRTAALDGAFADVEATLDGILANLSLNQRDDGEIRDARVKLHTLSTDVRALLAAGQGLPRGAWVTATAYALRDIVIQGGNTYICAVAHTAGTFATDLAAVRWMLLSLGAATAAAGMPFSPGATLSATNVQAAIDEADSENRVLSAAASELATALRTDLAAPGTLTGAALVAFLAAGIGPASRTVQDKIRDIYSSGDATTLAAAVSNAYSAGNALFMPPGTIATAASIPNLHDVPKWGPGSITRGSDVFYACPTAAQTNRIYVNPTGSNLNDGLSAAQPLQTLQGAFDVLAKYGPSLPGTWEVILAAGTYAGLATFPENVRGQNRVLIRGPLVGHPNVPTAIIDGGGVQSFGLNFNGNNKVALSNLLIRNCTTYGWVAQDFCDVYTVNVHISGITGGDGGKMQQGRVRVQGGIIQTCAAYGLNFISGTTMTVGESAVSLATGPQIKLCSQGGILAQENTTGHADYVTIDSCAVGLDIIGSSRIHAASSSIINNATAGVRTRAASHWFNNGSTLTGNAVNELNYGFSQEIGSSGGYVSALRSVGDVVQVTHTGTTSETTLKTYSPGIRKNSFVWSGRSLRVVITGQFTGVAGVKTLRVKVAGTLIHGLATASASAGFFRYEGVLRAVDSTNQTYDAQLITNGAAVVADGGSRVIGMAGGSDQAITITGQLGASGDSIVISNVELWETA